MVAPTSLTLVETYEDRIRRLGAKARAEGVELFVDDLGRWFATSRRDPSRLHVITAWSCSCEGFLQCGECGHHSLLLLTIGFVPTDPEPGPPAATQPVPLSVFRDIEQALSGPDGADLAFALEVNLRQPERTGDDEPTHDELLVACGIDCTPDTFLRWCDQQARRQEVIDRAEMIEVAA